MKDEIPTKAQADEPDALREARDGAMEEVIEAVSEWSRPGHVRLHVGEMTAQESRTVQAVVSGIMAELCRLKASPATSAS